MIALNEAMLEWKRQFWSGLSPLLAMSDHGTELHILDSRSCALSGNIILRGEHRDAYLACTAMPSRAKLNADPAIVEDLKARNLLLEIDGRLLTLALEGEIPSLPPSWTFPGGWVKAKRVPRAPAPRATQSVSMGG